MKESLLQVRTHKSVTTPSNRRAGFISWIISSVAFMLIAKKSINYENTKTRNQCILSHKTCYVVFSWIFLMVYRLVVG